MAITAASPLFSWWTLCVCVCVGAAHKSWRFEVWAGSRFETSNRLLIKAFVFHSEVVCIFNAAWAVMLQDLLLLCVWGDVRHHLCDVINPPTKLLHWHGRATLIFKRQRELILIFLHHIGAHVGPPVWGSCQTGFSACWKSGLETLIVMGKHLCQIENIGLIFGGLK